jgi:hypothetical protein
MVFLKLLSFTAEVRHDKAATKKKKPLTQRDAERERDFQRKISAR